MLSREEHQLDATTELIEIKPVFDLTVRCMIDAGARIGRIMTRVSGQTIELLSFKGMRGMTENIVCNAFPVLGPHHCRPPPG
jgi:hypothetical protein